MANRNGLDLLQAAVNELSGLQASLPPTPRDREIDALTAERDAALARAERAEAVVQAARMIQAEAWYAIGAIEAQVPPERMTDLDAALAAYDGPDAGEGGA